VLAAAISSGAPLSLKAIAIFSNQRNRFARCAWLALAWAALVWAAFAHGGLTQVAEALAVSRAAGCAALRNAPLPLLRRPLGMSTTPKQARYRRFPR
jgi:hypothetical protein